MKKLLMGLLAALLISGCTTPTVAPDPLVLRVGVTPDSPPLIFKAGGEISGLEVSFAEKLGRGLGREVVFVEVPWDKQIDYLEQNKTDIIMSGMTATAARGIRINFTNPYMRSGQSALFRRESYSSAGLIASFAMNQGKGIGYVKDTSGALFVMERFPRFDKKDYSSVQAGVSALKKGKINVLLYDAPMLWNFFSRNESDLIAFPEMLTVEPLAWGVRKNDPELLSAANALLAEWEEDGTMQEMVLNWVTGAAAGQNLPRLRKNKA